jgi:hypothetical protein
MNTHNLKTDPKVFALSYCGTKKYEIRYNDRNFMSGDDLILEETKYSGKEMIDYGKPLIYTGRQLMRRVDHVLDGYGLLPGWVILSVSKF